MTIRPVDVRRKEFKTGFRGYDANQVDDFLDEVADEFERSYAENRRISEELTILKGRLEQFEELESAIREALVHAQQVARDLRRNANKEAELVVREAKEQAHRILADSSARVERVQESYEVLRKAKQDFNNDFRHLLKTYAAVMDNADVLSAKEIEASLRERLDTESIATARQAAETQRMEAGGDAPGGGETASQETSPGAGTGLEAGVEPDDATRRLEKGPSSGSTPAGGRDGAGREPGAEPEVEERKVEPSGGARAVSGSGSGGEETQRREAPFGPAASERGEQTAADSGASDEADREEPMPAGEGRSADDFFNTEEHKRPEEEEGEGRIFRVSRFLRRRG